MKTQGQTNRQPIAVLISDVHYNIQTLEVADKALQLAVNKANTLKLPLIIAGDLHDTKANLRAECMMALAATLNSLDHGFILRGNHDSLNEKSEVSALNSLTIHHNVKLIDNFIKLETPELYLIPYQPRPEILKFYLKTIPPGNIVIMHQGLQGSDSGEYFQDHSAINHEDVAHLRVISGHYHARQDIKTGSPQKNAVGLWSYLGNPYTLNFGESKDPAKGFQVLYSDGTLEFIPTNLRKHIIFEMTTKELKGTVLVYNPEDLLRLKITGPKENLAKLTRETVVTSLGINAAQVRIDFIPIDLKSANPDNGGKVADMSPSEILDGMIKNANISDEQKSRLSKLWKYLK